VAIKNAVGPGKKDTIGLTAARATISGSASKLSHAGGIGPFIGVESCARPRRQLVEAYYNWALYSHANLSADYQRISNPALQRADREPVNIFALRLR
jgi:hypothetical protein